jgi:tetratricopeptide (TPR) repeat protein
MLKRDYILNIIEQFGRALANIIGLINLADYRLAQETLQQTADNYLGLRVDQLENESALDLLARVRTGRPETDISNWVILTELLCVRGDLYHATGQERVAVETYLKALDAATEVGRKAEIFPYFQAPINQLQERLTNYVLPLPIAQKLFTGYELSGEYAAAEDLLFDLIDTTSNDPAIIEMGLAFYDRLWQISDYRLLQGGLSREEVEESMGELLALS